MAVLPQHSFQFSQASLQDYVDCARRFQLRYLSRLSWPAIETEPVLENERFLNQGAQFHRLVHQYLLGIPAERLSAMVQAEDLSRWWENFLQYGLNPQEVQGKFFPEITLATPLGEHSLVGKFDLVVVSPGGEVSIMDWKTSRKRPQRNWLEKRLQTHVYPFLLVEAGACLNHAEPILPEQVEMVYWFAQYPRQPERFSYDREKYLSDKSYLNELVEEIQALDEDGFELTKDRKKSRFCVYRSLCNRGIEAGSMQEMDAMLDSELGGQAEQTIDLDFEQIAEIEF
jgi:hypothetical protein